MSGPEQKARVQIDSALGDAGWVLQNRDEMNSVCRARRRCARVQAGAWVWLRRLHAVRRWQGRRRPRGEARRAHAHRRRGPGREVFEGIARGLNPPVEPLPFLYLSTGAITKFTNLLDPEPRSRRIFQVHQPGALADWLAAETLDAWVKGHGGFTAADNSRPSSFRARLRAMPSAEKAFLFNNQLQAVINLEHSLFQNRPRALVQMATGSGKTIMAVTAAYRLIKFGGARRVLFLVDRANLGEQAEKEFQGYRTPDDNRKFTELYNVQRLTSNTIGAVGEGGHHHHPAALLDAQGRAGPGPRGRGSVASSSAGAADEGAAARSSTTRPTRPSTST